MGATQSTSAPYAHRTTRARYHGIEQRDLSGRPILHRFTRIRYARPPVGSLRFRRPQKLSPSEQNVANDGSASDTDSLGFGPIAPQPVYATSEARVESPDPDEQPPLQDEDCLYLNIWVPLTDSPPEAGWPVQFHIHGGWLQIGQANQTFEEDPFDIFASDKLTNRIVVAPTYRLNILGFAAGSDLNEVVRMEGDAFAGNYGLWDQRAALEWVHENISDFGGNPNLITVGGLSAGAHSAWLQLYYDSFLPEHQRVISQVYLWSNALAVQPNPTEGELLTSQFNELCEAVGITGSSSLSSKEKIDKLRKVDYWLLIDAIPKLKMHTFRSSTDGPIENGGFIPPTYLESLQDGTLATRLAERGVRIMLGEVKDEGLLYKLINPPISRDGLKIQLGNYYPKTVVDTLVKLPVYNIPESDEGISKSDWAEIFGNITGDCQVHASMRGLVGSLLKPPSGSKALTRNQIFRYKVSWRAKCLDATLKPEMGVCHSADQPIWWASGWRAGYTDEDKRKAELFLEPFGKFLQGQKDIGWGGTGALDELRLFDENGNVKEGARDEDWTRALSVWDAILKAQRK